MELKRCSRCQVRPAIIFVQKNVAGKITSEGYCIKCAQELGIKPIDDILNQMNISPEDIDTVSPSTSFMMTSYSEENAEAYPSSTTKTFSMRSPEYDSAFSRLISTNTACERIGSKIDTAHSAQNIALLLNLLNTNATVTHTNMQSKKSKAPINFALSDIL